VLDESQRAHSAAVAALGAAEERIRQARETATRIDALRLDLVAAEREVSDWTRLAADIGSNGLQASLVDAAGPELTETANHLLHTCFGSRWSLQVSTQRQSADGKKIIEECEVRVIDEGDESETAPARTGEGRTFSGGEKGILNDAFFFALTHLARNAGITNPDLVIDEWGANLNEEKRSRWVSMLRLACDIIGTKHCYIATHNEDIKALADARIIVERGEVRIEQ
jgi:exonuclease SbcC